MKDKSIEDHGLPSIEETKLGNILQDLPEEVQDVKDSIFQISNKYRQDLTNQLESSYQFEQHLARNFQKINKKSKRLYQKSEGLNSSLNKRLDQLKSYDEISGLSIDITDSVFGIVESLTQIEMILPYNERLGVRDSPHRAHYPNLYKLLNPNDDSTIKDEISSFEQLDAEGQEDLNEADESDNGESIGEHDGESGAEGALEGDVQNEEQGDEQNEQGEELRSVGEDRSDTINPQEFNERESEIVEKQENDNYHEEANTSELIEHDYPDPDEESPAVEDQASASNDQESNKKESTKDQEPIQKSNPIELQREDSPKSSKVSENTKHEESEKETKSITSENIAKQQELESVIDNYTSSKALKQEKHRSQSMRSFRPVKSSISIPSPSSAGVVATTVLSANNEFSQFNNSLIPAEAHGTIVSGTSSSSHGSGSVLADNLKRFISQNKSFSSENFSS